jgi:hypothetical protein
MTDINKADLEAKLREIEGVVTDVEEEARSNIQTVVAVVAFMVWKSRRSKIRVEVYKS